MISNLSEGDALLRQLAALSNPHRLRIIAVLSQRGRRYVSELARLVGISRPLLYLHLEKLATAGLVKSELSLSDDGKALKWFEVCDFELTLSPDRIAAITASITDTKENDG